LNYAGGYASREYYVNNSRESKQIIELGKTALGEGQQYKTPTLEEKIEALDFSGCSEKEAGLRLAGEVQKENSAFVTETLGIDFDRFFDEDQELTQSGAIQHMLDRLRAKECTYEHEGAEWIKTSEYGDDDDRVIVRSDGSGSYFLSDIAYHDDKFSRGLDAVFNVWGADHGGHEKRMMAVKKMLEWPGNLHIFISQMVMLKGEEGEREKMSKRAGNVILLEDLVSEIDVDVVRWFFLEKALSTQMDFDLELARKTSEKNPLRYVQYAQARMCSIMKKAGIKKSGEEGHETTPLGDIFSEKQAHRLSVKLLQFEEVIEDIVRNYGVHKLTTYAYELAGVFNQFYRDVRVIEQDGSVNHEALELVIATRRVLSKSLDLLGISAPEEM
jgi:arginyl-tRNA synthetase